MAVASLLSCQVKIHESRDEQNEVVVVEEFDSLCRKAITHDQLRAQKEIALLLPKTCDSVKIYFPPGGTTTGAALFMDSTMKNKVCSTPSFAINESSLGFMTISTQMKGKFYLSYGSCHWGSQIWITLK